MATQQSETRSLAGRTHETAALLRQLELASEGTTRVVMLAGEPGIGKSRLLEWLENQAAGNGAAVLRGGAFQAEGMPPYLPVIEAFGRYIREAEVDRLRQELDRIDGVLGTILPDVAARLGDVSSAYDLPPEQSRLRLFEAAGSFLSAIARSQPVVLSLDDLQWCDSSTLELLYYVTRTHNRNRLLIVGAYRDDEVTDRAQLQRALAELTRQRLMTRIHVGPLSAGEIDALVSAWLDGPVATDVSQLLHRQCEGNPFFAEELIQEWLESGALTREGGTWTADSWPTQRFPASVVAAIDQRLERLPAETVETLRVASVIGRTFQVSLLAGVCNEEADVIEGRLIPAERMRLVETADGAAYRFRHDLVRECLYLDVPPGRRRRVHGAIGAALEKREESDLADLAFHFGRSDDRERAVTYAWRAGDEALHRSAVTEALAEYEIAVNALEPADRRRGQLLLQHGDAALLAGREDVAARSYEAAQSLLATSDPYGAGRAAHGLGVTRLRQDRILEAYVALEAALHSLGDGKDREAVRVLVDLATVLTVNLARQDEGMLRGREALELADRLGDDRLAAAAGRAVGNLQVRANRVAEGTRLLREALVLAEACDDQAEIAECCGCLANATYWSADLDSSRDYTMMREEAARRSQQPFEMRHIYSWSAFLAATRGNWDQAQRLLETARPTVERLSSGEPLGFWHQIEGFLAWERGNYVLAEREFDSAIAIFREHGTDEVIWYLGSAGLAQLAMGRRERAEATLDELDRLIDTRPEQSLSTAPALTCGLLLAVRLREIDRADRLYRRLRAFAGQLHWFLVDRSLAALELARGDIPAAVTTLDRAEATAARAGMGSVLAAIREERTRGGLKQTRPAGLSRREVEVLRLVAAGMSNREIAHQLNLSDSTVAKHLTSIFTKTDTTNRAAATAFALRHGIGE